MVLRLRIAPPGKWQRAKCRNIQITRDADPFFDDGMDEALVYCNGEADGVLCPIRHDCLIFALTNNLQFGVWGGCSELTRRALRKRWPLQGKKPRPEWHWQTEAEAVEGITHLLAEPDEQDDEDDDEFVA